MDETTKVKKHLIERDLIDSFDTIPMKSFDKFRLQIHLNNLGQGEIQRSRPSSSRLPA